MLQILKIQTVLQVEFFSSFVMASSISRSTLSRFFRVNLIDPVLILCFKLESSFFLSIMDLTLDKSFFDSVIPFMEKPK